MTAITDAKLIIETALGHTVSAALLIRIADAYAEADPHSLVRNGDVVVVDPENLTNEEKAQIYIGTLVANGRAVVGNVSDINSDDDAEAARVANRTTAEADWA